MKQALSRRHNFIQGKKPTMINPCHFFMFGECFAVRVLTLCRLLYVLSGDALQPVLAFGIRALISRRSPGFFWFLLFGMFHAFARH